MQAKLLLFGAGAATTLSYSPFNIWPLVFIAFAIFFRTISKATTTKQAALSGFIFGLGWFAFGISWVHVAIADFGGLPIVLSLLLMLLLVSYLALFPALSGYLAFRLLPKLGIFGLLPAWLVTEWIRSWMLTGFPWLSIGYTQLYSPLAGFAPIVGEFGLQAIVVVISLSLITKHKIAWCSAISLFGISLFLNQLNWHQNTDKQVKLALVQGNIAQSVKWQPENEIPTMQKYFDLSLPHLASADVVLWPEAAIPRLEVLANDFLQDMDRIANENNTAIVTGIVDFQPDTNFAFNNIIVMGNKRENDEFGHYKYLDSNRYSKHHLLPIGEFVPFESVLRTLAPLFNLPMSSFNRGAYQQDNLIANGLNVSSAICFEIAFANQVRANLYDDSNFILTISNDAWFGDSHGPWQHLQIAQMRALEFAKPVIRITNNGITAIIDEKGKISNMLEQNVAGVLSHQLTISEAKTPYKQLGNLPTWLLIILFSAGLYWFQSTSKNQK